MKEIDFDLLIDECDKNIEKILKSIPVDYIIENGWICLKCCFHNGTKYNLKYRDKSFFCFSECRRNYTIIDVTAKLLELDLYNASVWLTEILNINCSLGNREIDTTVRESNKILSQYKNIKKKEKIQYNPVPQVILNDIEPCYCKYTHDWGISEDTAKEFGIGIARGGELESRIVFPIDSPNGDIVTLSGRLPKAEELGLKKYHILGNSESKYTLYNISRARHFAKEMGYIIVVEGMKSVLALWEWGYKNAVAVIGSSISKEQADLLLKIGVKIVVIGDNDEAGRQLNQSVYNRLYKYLPVIKVDINKVTDVIKASVDDIGKKKFELLLEYIGLIEETDF